MLVRINLLSYWIKNKGDRKMTKSNGRLELEKAIMDKVQSIFDNAQFINNFEIHIAGGVDEVTRIKYTVDEHIIPNKEIKNDTN